MSDTVTVRTEMKFKAWVVPKFAALDMPPLPKQEGIHPLPSFPIEELDPAVLDALAQQWLDHLYACCNREPPFRKVGP